MNEIADKEIIATVGGPKEIKWTARMIWGLATPYLLFIGLMTLAAVLIYA